MQPVSNMIHMRPTAGLPFEGEIGSSIGQPTPGLHRAATQGVRVFLYVFIMSLIIFIYFEVF